MSTAIGSYAPHYESATKKKWAKRLLPLSLILSSLLLLVLGAVLGFYAYVSWALTHPDVAALASNPQESVGLAYENVSFSSQDGLTDLSGWYIPAKGAARTVVFSHGYGENREQSWVHVYDLVKALNKAGYNVLMFDYGFVQPGVSVTGGVRESQELLGAIGYAKAKGADHVYVWGFSMGAGTALQTALLGPGVDGMILDSTFMLNPDTLYQNLKAKIDLPRYPSLPLIQFFFPILDGVSLDDIPFQQVTDASFSIPIYFIHSKLDAKAPYSYIVNLFHRQPKNKSRLWVVDDSKHEMIFRQHKSEYLHRTLGFLQQLSVPAKVVHSLVH